MLLGGLRVFLGGLRVLLAAAFLGGLVVLLWATAPPRTSAPWPPMATRRLSMATMECIARLNCIGQVSLQVPDAMS